MICDLCLANPATHRVTEGTSSGRFEDSLCCDACLNAIYVKRSPPRDFPRPRFTLKNAMILLGMWTIPNALVSWIMRSGYITGTPDQLRQWTVQAFVGANLCFGFFAVHTYVLTWLSSVMYHRRTGGRVPMPVRTMTFVEYLHVFLCVLPVLAWSIIGVFLEWWLYRTQVWVRSIPVGSRLALILGLPYSAILFLSLLRNPDFLSSVRRTWRFASHRERFWRFLGASWSIAAIIGMFGCPSFSTWSAPWFPISTLLMVMILGQVALLAAAAFSTRARR
jgi:hypothetical protein